MPYGGNSLAVFLAATSSAEEVKPKYGGNFSAVGGFLFFGGNDFGGGGKTKIWRETAILPLPPARALILRRENYQR